MNHRYRSMLCVMLSAYCMLDLSPALARSKRAPKLDADKLLQEARLSQRAGRREEAEAKVDQVLAADSRNADANLMKGTLELQHGRDESAEAYYRKVIERAPKYTDAYLGLSNVYLRRREPENAELVLTWIPKGAVHGAEVTAQRAEIAKSRGMFWKARHLFDEAIAAQPENTDFQDARKQTPIFFNSTTYESEQFKRTGQVSVINNTFTYRPDRRLSVDVIAEKWFRSRGVDAERAGIGVSVAPTDRITLHGQVLESSDRVGIPTRYDLDADVLVLEKPGTHLLAGFTRYDSSPVDTDVQSLGVKQYFTEKLAVQAQRFWAKDNGFSAVGAETDVFRLIWEDPGVRNLALGYATGNEAFRVDQVGILPGRDYDFNSVFVSAKQWIGDNWGLLGGAALNERSNGNDSTAFNAGVFFSF